VAGLLASDEGDQLREAARAFHMFTPTHGLVVIAFIGVAAIVLAIGVHLRGTPRQRGYERLLGCLGVIIWIAANGYGFLPGVFEWSGSLPIHVCDLAALAGPIVLLQPHPQPWLRAWLYFAGIGLCTQAFITPTLEEGPGDPQFWFFWSGHFVILICALYDVLVRRWRPTWREWRIAIALSLVYLFIILPINLWQGWNYAFVGRETPDGTLIEILGPWPWRVAVIVGLVIVMYALLMVPWTVARNGARGD